MKRILAFLLAALMLSGMMVVAAHAAGGTLTVSSVTASPGRNFTLTYTLTQTQVKALVIEPPVIDGCELVSNEWLIDSVITDSENGQSAKLQDISSTEFPLAVLAYEDPQDFNGQKIYSATYKVKDDAKEGEIEVGCANFICKTGKDDTDTAITIEKGKVKISKVLRGDFNDDGKVTTKDAIYLLRAYFDRETYKLNQDEDLNHDGKFSTKDAIYLLRHYFDKATYPLD